MVRPPYSISANYPSLREALNPSVSGLNSAGAGRASTSILESTALRGVKPPDANEQKTMKSQALHGQQTR